MDLTKFGKLDQLLYVLNVGSQENERCSTEWIAPT